MPFSLALLAALLAAPPESFTREAAIARARTLVATERTLDAASLEVEQAAAATWPDAGLGCPEKGRVYAQMLTEGYRVVLRHGESRFDVRVTAGHAALCGPRTASPVAVADLQAAARVQQLARADLAARWGVPVEAVRVDFVKPKIWPDSRLGCPGEAPADARDTPGFEIRLSRDAEQVTYHADHTRVVRCDAAR